MFALRIIIVCLGIGGCIAATLCSHRSRKTGRAETEGLSDRSDGVERRKPAAKRVFGNVRLEDKKSPQWIQQILLNRDRNQKGKRSGQRSMMIRSVGDERQGLLENYLEQQSKSRNLHNKVTDIEDLLHGVNLRELLRGITKCNEKNALADERIAPAALAGDSSDEDKRVFGTSRVDGKRWGTGLNEIRLGSTESMSDDNSGDKENRQTKNIKDSEEIRYETNTQNVDDEENELNDLDIYRGKRSTERFYLQNAIRASQSYRRPIWSPRTRTEERDYRVNNGGMLEHREDENVLLTKLGNGIDIVTVGDTVYRVSNEPVGSYDSVDDQDDWSKNKRYEESYRPPTSRHLPRLQADYEDKRVFGTSRVLN